MSDNNKTTYIYGTEKISVPADWSVDEVRSMWADLFPAVQTAEMRVKDDGSREFFTTGGTKG